MRIINLVENTEGCADCRTEHGLSFYIETKHHKILMDTGASALFLENAGKISVDLSGVDTVILSHGHYDHGGGLPAAARVCPDAKIYMQRSALGAFYSLRQGAPDTEKPAERYIGLPPEARDLPQTILLDGGCRIDDELAVFADIGTGYPVPETNRRLKEKTENGFIQDDFRHEQCLVIHQEDRKYLFSGCAHHGILNIMERFRTLYGCDPDAAFSGFHLMKKNGYTEDELQEIIYTAHTLSRYKTVFYTGHCTGETAFSVMKDIMKEQLQYVHCGDTVNVPGLD